MIRMKLGLLFSSQDAKSSDALHASSVFKRMGRSNVPSSLREFWKKKGEDVDVGWPISLLGGFIGTVQLTRIKSAPVLCAVKPNCKHLNEETDGLVNKLQ